MLGLSSPRFEKLPAGSRIEVSPASFKIARQIGGLLHDSADRAHTAGSALIVDYGGDKVFGSSFRVSGLSCRLLAHSVALPFPADPSASGIVVPRVLHFCELHLISHTHSVVRVQGFKNHKLVDVFHRPGECDLTVNVDFAYLREAAKGLGMSLSLTVPALLPRLARDIEVAEGRHMTLHTPPPPPFCPPRGRTTPGPKLRRP